MIEGISCLLPPILGGVIGFMTNDIAIRMLFRPRRPKFIFGLHVPFTPGLIPKEKGRIAVAIGGAISENLMNKDVLERYLLSDEMVSKVRLATEHYLLSLRNSDETLKQFLLHYITEEDIASITESINENISEQVNEKLSNSEVGEKVAHISMEYVANKLSVSGGKELLIGIGGAMGGLGGAAASLFGGSLIGKFLGMLREPTEKFLAKNINEMLRDNGQEIVEKMVDDEMEILLNKKVSGLLTENEENIVNIPNTVVSIYTSIIKDHLPKLLQSINISKLIEERINEMDVIETETIILQVMDKELKAIVWVGAGLGAIIGCINVFV